MVIPTLWQGLDLVLKYIHVHSVSSQFILIFSVLKHNSQHTLRFASSLKEILGMRRPLAIIHSGAAVILVMNSARFNQIPTLAPELNLPNNKPLIITGGAPISRPACKLSQSSAISTTPTL
jgi:hypothetical protein